MSRIVKKIGNCWRTLADESVSKFESQSNPEQLKFWELERIVNRLSFASILLAYVIVIGPSFVQPSAVLASGGSSSGSVAPPGTYDVGGTIYSINWFEGYVVVETQKGCFQAIYPNNDTVVTIRGVPATLADMKVGNRIRSNNSLTTGHILAMDLR